MIEVNAAPGFYYHYFKRDGRVPVATLILERLAERSAMSPPPVILAGANMVTAFPIIRSLGRAGVDVQPALQARRGAHCVLQIRPSPAHRRPGSQPEAWLRYLLGAGLRRLARRRPPRLQ